MIGRYVRGLVPLVLVLAACGTDDGSSLSSQGAASFAYWFNTLPKMVATSDVVILGTVVDVRDGRTTGPPGEEIEHLDAEIRVDQSLYGSADETSTLIVQTLKFVAPEREWRDVGNRVLAFLNQSSDPEDEGRYYVVNYQTIYVVVDADIQTAVGGDPLSERIASMSIDEVRDAIKATIPDISGDVTPQAPVGG
jgi:hypothetical protein